MTPVNFGFITAEMLQVVRAENKEQLASCINYSIASGYPIC